MIEFAGLLARRDVYLAAVAAVRSKPRGKITAPGGIVSRPKLAMIAEHGPERVMPLKRSGGSA